MIRVSRINTCKYVYLRVLFIILNIVIICNDNNIFITRITFYFCFGNRTRWNPRRAANGRTGGAQTFRTFYSAKASFPVVVQDVVNKARHILAGHAGSEKSLLKIKMLT